MPRARRVDANQAAIVEALRAAGCSVQDLHEVGDGCPDLLVGFTDRDGVGHNYVLEVKGPRGWLTGKQPKWHRNWKGQKAIVRSPLEALEALGLVPF
jgi:hypothetical protein